MYPKIIPVLNTDDSPVGMSIDIRKDGKPVSCVSPSLIKAEPGYSQTRLEALTVSWTVKLPHKCLFYIPLQIVADREALMLTFNRTNFFLCAYHSMLRKRSITLSVKLYDCAQIHVLTVYLALIHVYQMIPLGNSWFGLY